MTNPNRTWRTGLPFSGISMTVLCMLSFIVFPLMPAGCSRVPKIIVLEDPLTAPEHLDLGVAYERKGDLDLAQREYERALRKEKKYFPARFNLGNVFLAKKDYGKARAEYLKALEIRPGDPGAVNNLAWCAILSGEGIDDALARMEKTVSAPSGRRPEFMDTLGVLLTRANRPEPAADAFSEAERLCNEAGSAHPKDAGKDGATGPGPSLCPEETRREIAEHRKELRRRFPATSSPPALIK
jgi:Tfp pilus assembly protein PilF